MTPTEIAALVGGVSTGVSGVAFFLTLMFAPQSLKTKGDAASLPMRVATQQLRAMLGGVLSLVALGAFCAVCVGQTYKTRSDGTEIIWGEYIAAASSIVLPITLCLSLFNGLGGRLACPALALAAFVFEILGILMPSFGNFLFTIFSGVCFLLAILALFSSERLEVSRKRGVTLDGEYPAPFWRTGVALQLAIGFVLFILDTGVFDVYNGSHIVPTILWVVFTFSSFIGAFLLLFLTDPASYDKSGAFNGSSEDTVQSSINGRSANAAAATAGNGLTSCNGLRYDPV